MDADWEELTREAVNMHNGPAAIILMRKTAQTSESILQNVNARRSGCNLPLPPKSAKPDVEYYRVIIMHTFDRKILAQCDLSPQACDRLLKVKPSHLDSNSSQLTANELMQLD